MEPYLVVLYKISFQRDKLQRRRFGADVRLKDERVNRRERDNRGERYDRFENLQQSEFQSKNDGPDGGNLDESMLDSFGGQGLHVAPPFPSDIPPPPVLMPVPGAGYALCFSFVLKVICSLIFHFLEILFCIVVIAVHWGLLFQLHLKLQ